jgi:hypothetical protein
MKLAGSRLRLVAVALLTLVTGALIVPVAVSAHQQPASGNGGKCYEQVTEYRYERTTYTTEYKMIKVTRERTGNTSPWSAWTPFDGGSVWKWEQDNTDGNEAHLDGHHNHPNKYDRDYKYVWDGTTTRQVESGTETSDWLPGPPEGEGWVQIDERTVNREIECPPWQKVTICHATASDGNPYTTNEVSYRSINNEYEIDWNGHGNHAGDIIPAFGDFPGQGDTSLLQYNDCQRPKPEQPDFPPEVVETYGNCASGAGLVTGTRTITKFKAVFNTATWTWDKVQDGDPVVEQISRPLTADEQNACRPSKPPTVDREEVGEPECGDTTIKIKVTTTTYSYTYNIQTKAWDEHAEQEVTYEVRQLTTDEWCDIDPPAAVGTYDCYADEATAVLSPGSDPRWTATGDEDDSVLGYRFVVTAKPGYHFDGSSAVTLEGTIDDSDRSCEATPVAPKLTTSQECGVVDTYTIPTTPGVVYLVDGEAVDAGTYDLPAGAEVVVTAKAAQGHRLVGSLDEELEGGTVEPCPVDPPTVVSGYDCLADAPTAYVSPASDDHWTVTGDEDDSALGYRFVVTAKPGYVFPGGKTEVTLEGTIDDSDRDCEATPVIPKLTTSQECGVVDTYTIPATLGVDYLLDGEAVDAGTYDLPEGTTVVITAKAAEGYRLVGSLEKSLTGGAVEPCPIDPPTVVSGYDCLADEATAALSPDSDANWTATSDEDDSEFGYRFVITAKPGFVFGEGKSEVILDGEIDGSNRSCEVTPVAPELTTSEECGVVDTYTIPSTTGVVYTVDGDAVAAGTFDLPAGTSVIVTADAAEGYRLVGSLEKTLTGGSVEECPPSEWPHPTAEPVCGADNDMVTVPADTDDVHFTDSGWANGVRTVTATWTHDGSELDSWEFTDAGEACPPQTTPSESLDIVAMGPACLNDAPYIEVTFGDQPQFNGRPATVTFIDLDGNVVGTATATYQAGATVRFVYPGATVDAAGNAVDWPGWMLVGDVWTHDPSDAHLRDGLTVVVEVNPTATGSVTYPDATAACADPQIAQTVPAPTTSVPQGQLPVTR